MSELNAEIAEAEIEVTPGEDLAPEDSLEPSQTNENEGFQENSDQFNADNELAEKTADEAVAEDKPAKAPSRLQSRIDELTADRRNAERRAFAAEAELQQLKNTLSNETEPVEDNFEHYKDYVKAVARWTANQSRIETATKQVEDSVRQVQAHDAEYQKTKMHEGMDRFPDFAEKAALLGKVFHPGTEAYDTLFDSDQFAEVAYFLSNNLVEAMRIAELPSRIQAREIIKLETAIESGHQPIPVKQDLPKPVRSVSQAPAPARQVLTGKTDSQRLSPERETMEQYAARRQKEIRGR